MNSDVFIEKIIQAEQQVEHSIELAKIKVQQDIEKATKKSQSLHAKSFQKLLNKKQQFLEEKDREIALLDSKMQEISVAQINALHSVVDNKVDGIVDKLFKEILQ